MTLTMGLRYKNPDASTDINLRLKDVARKGFVSGADLVVVPGLMSVDVTPFVCVSYDGAVVRSDETIRVNIATPNVVNYVFLRARYVQFGSPVMSVECVDATEFGVLNAAEGNWLHIIGTINNPAPPSVLASQISYTQRHTLDAQARSFFREPAASYGALPRLNPDNTPYNNRDGDVRMTLDSKSLFTWSASAGDWIQLNEASLNSHRDEEHCNGIVGSSSSGSLAPTTSSVNISLAPLPAGSAVTIDGLRLGGPITPPTISAGAGGRTSEGLIQVWMDSSSSTFAEYRAYYAAAPNITGVTVADISDNHASSGVGTFVLSFNHTTTALRWDNGEPVVVSTPGRYRLYRPSYAEWIEVSVTAGLPVGSSTTDSIAVQASRKTDQTFLIAHYRWDGSSVLTMTKDKRVFGNLGYQEMSEDFKAGPFTGPWTDTRGTMVYSGGDVSIVGNKVQVNGPLIAYVQGRRHVVPIVKGSESGYGGISLPNGANYLYVDEAGVFQTSTTDPLAGPSGTSFLDWNANAKVAPIAKVQVSGGVPTLVTDVRDPQLIVGQATRDSRVLLSKTGSLRWQESSSTLSIENQNEYTDAKLNVGTTTTNLLLAKRSGGLGSTDHNIYMDGPDPKIKIDITTGDRATLGEVRSLSDPNKFWDVYYDANYEFGQAAQVSVLHPSDNWKWVNKTTPSGAATEVLNLNNDALELYKLGILTSGLMVSGSPENVGGENKFQINNTIEVVSRAIAGTSSAPTTPLIGTQQFWAHSNTTTGLSGAHIAFGLNFNAAVGDQADGFIFDFWRPNSDSVQLEWSKYIDAVKTQLITVTANKSPIKNQVTIGVSSDTNVTINGGLTSTDDVTVNGRLTVTEDVDIGSASSSHNFNGLIFFKSSNPYEMDGLPHFTLNADNQVAGWCVVQTNGTGGVSVPVSKGISASEVSILGSGITSRIAVTFDSPLPTNNYAVFLQPQSSGYTTTRVFNRLASGFECNAAELDDGGGTLQLNPYDWSAQIRTMLIAILYKY